MKLLTSVPKFKGKRVFVVGLGLFGGQVGLIRYLAKQGARVTVTDLKTAEELKESVDKLKGLNVELRLGAHRESDVDSADLVMPSPAVDPDSPLLRRAVEKKIPIDTELNLFFKLCKSKRIVGVTGSAGKTTTTMLVHEILRKCDPRVWLGGNIGKSLLEDVGKIRSNDLVVLELSSFQLENLAALERSPNVAVVTNLMPNHLDRHKTMENYAAAKRVIVEHQSAADTKVLNWEDPVVRSFSSPSLTFFFSMAGAHERGATLVGNTIHVRADGRRWEIDTSRRRLPGEFNLRNMMAAACATYPLLDAGAWRAACEEVFNSFAGVEHRLEFVCEAQNIKYYNDSKSTVPESTIKALDALEGPFVLILGGYDKKLPFDSLVDKLCSGHVRHVVLVGQTAPAIKKLLDGRPGHPPYDLADSFEDAVCAAVRRARPGDTVLLSPACASWDMFRNFVERGEAFKRIIACLVA